MAVLECALPAGLPEGTHELALCLYEALVLTDVRAGTPTPGDAWMQQLSAWALLVLAQLRHVSRELGGRGGLYVSKGLAALVERNARNDEMCAKFRGNNYRELAREYDLSEVSVRQIVDEWQRQRFMTKQTCLPGLDAT